MVYFDGLYYKIIAQCTLQNISFTMVHFDGLYGLYYSTMHDTKSVKFPLAFQGILFFLVYF
jgi:hypothetical protein